MKKQLLLKFGMIITLVFLFMRFSYSKPDAIMGKWQSSDNDRRIEVYKENQQDFAKIIWQQPDKFRANVGDIVIREIEFQNPHWEGKIWVPEIKSDFTANIFLQSQNELKIEATNGFIKKVKVWTKIK
ncbi:MAG: DUF2147 domain-containing protein [Flavobacterium sp.]|nr:DUF2147 domain-containing protein [Flavobacterium sp.]